MKWFPVFLLTTLLIANAQIPINGGGGKNSSGGVISVTGTANQITCTTTSGDVACGLASPPIIQSNLVADYHFDEGVGPYVYNYASPRQPNYNLIGPSEQA